MKLFYFRIKLLETVFEANLKWREDPSFEMLHLICTLILSCRPGRTDKKSVSTDSILEEP